MGDRLRIRQGYDEKIVIVCALSEVRGSAAQAALLFDETLESKAAREEAALMGKLAGPKSAPEERPTKRDRRKIIRFLAQSL